MTYTITPLSKPTKGQSCPCGSSKLWDDCCEPIISLTKPATTAEALMRARFSAHVAGSQTFLQYSMLENAGKPVEVLPEAGQSAWTRLAIHSHELGKTPDMATVDFTAWFVEGEKERPHDEKGEFKKVGDTWFYSRALRLGPAPVKAAVKTGRNDPCPCGSGKKYKHCCLKG